MNKPLWILVLALLMAPAVAAEDETIFSTFVGKWHAEGAAFGAPSTSDMQWVDAELGGRFLRLDYQINRATPNGPQPFFTGIAYYQKSVAPFPANHKIQAFWADTNGNLHPISAHVEENALIANWGTPETEQGRTRYQIIDQNTVEVTDWVKMPDGWRQFNQTTFSRAKPKP